MTKALRMPEPVCNNCGGSKPNRYYKACQNCREKWREYSGRTPQRVIKAAPELLEALEKATVEMSYAGWGKKEVIYARQEALKTARTAIAKARGQS